MRKPILLTLAVLSLFALLPAALAGCSSQATPTPTTPVTVTNISAAGAKSLIDKNADNKDFGIVDVRTPDEYAGGHIATSINIDLNSGQFKTDILSLDKNKTYLVYCATGVRSANASAQMVGLGFQHVYNMLGGITAWKDNGYPTSTK